MNFKEEKTDIGMMEAQTDSCKSFVKSGHRYDTNLISLEGNTVTYTGKKGVDPTAGYMGRMKLSEKFFYVSFVIAKIDQGDDLSLGLCSDETPLNQHIGLSKGSIGIINQYLYVCGKKVELALKHSMKLNDRIGFGINYSKSYIDEEDWNAWIYYTHNGEMVGCQAVEFPAGGFYPAIGLSSSKEAVFVEYKRNFLPADPNDMLWLNYVKDSKSWARLDDVVFCRNYLKYTGKAKSILDVGLAQARNPLSPTDHFFEFVVMNPGRHCYIAIGLTPRGYPRRCHPGWNAGSIGYHADDGKLFCGSGVGEKFGPACSKYDRMGCGVIFPDDSQRDLNDVNSDTESECSYEVDMDLGDNKTDLLLQDQVVGSEVRVYFTHNGTMIGERSIKMPKHGLYPTVGMLSEGEVVYPILNGVTG